MSVKRLVIFATVVMILAGLLLSGLTDTTSSMPDTSIADNDLVTVASVEHESDSSASATITWGAAPLPDQ